MKREELETIRRSVIEMNISRGERKKEVVGSIESDMETAGECEDDVKNCIKWRFRTWVADLN